MLRSHPKQPRAESFVERLARWFGKREGTIRRQAPRGRFCRPGIEHLEVREMLDSGLPSGLVLGRTLSAYTTDAIVDHRETITYTVYNQLADPVSDLRLTDILQPGVAFESASQAPEQNGQELTWNLGTIDAYGRASVTVTVALGAGLPTAPVQLDAGAQVSGNQNGGVETDSAPPAVLRPGSVDAALLASTVDANTADPYIQEKAAALDYDPQRIFDFLNGDIGYESYAGSLRGSRGTLWSEAGNSLDEASLGVALFRASGIPARYAHGTLSDADAQALILSMFPEPTQIVGYLAPGTEVSDPANDTTLLAETRDHYWLQIDVGAGLVDADTSGLPGGGIGTAFTTISSTFTEVPDNLRHKVRVTLDAETYSQSAAAFSAGANGLTTATVLDRTFNSVDLVGRPLTVGQFVSDNNAGFGGLSSRTLTYTPHFLLGDTADPLGVNDEIFAGVAFQEVLTNFPFGSTILSGYVLGMDLQHPSGSTDHHERALVDRIGFAARQNSTTTTLTVDASGQPALTEFDKFTLSVLPGKFDPRYPVQLEARVAEHERYLSQFAGVPETSLPADYADRLRSFVTDVTRLLSIRNNQASDEMTDVVAKRALVRAYADSPRLMLAIGKVQAGTATEPGTIQFEIDLRRDTVRVVPTPGQSAVATAAFNIVRGVAATLIEKQVVAGSVPADQQELVINTDNVLRAAGAQGIPVIVLTPADLPTLANRLTASADALARITDALTAGQFVIVPESPVSLGTIRTTSWYDVNPLTGETISVGENGGHNAAIEYEKIVAAVGTGLILGINTFTITDVFFPEWKQLLADALAAVGTAEGLGSTLAASYFEAVAAVLASAFLLGFDSGFTLMQLLTGKDPPAEGQFWDIEPFDTTPHVDSITVTQSVIAGQPLRITPSVSTVTADQNTPVSVPFSVVTDYAGDYTVMATAPVGWLVALTNEAVSVTPAPGVQGGTDTVRLVVRSKANPDLVARADVDVVVTPTLPGVTLDVVFDPLMTVPFQGAQLPTGYQAVMRNLGPAAEPYTLAFSNVTPGWEVITTRAGMTIPAGTTGILGVYLRPTGTTIPAPGSPVSFSMSVTSTTNPALTQTKTVAFAMPEVSAPSLKLIPAMLSAVPDSTIAGSASVHNFGNITETITLSAATLPAGITITELPQTFTLAPGEWVDVPFSVAVANTVALNTTAYRRLSLDKTATGSTEPQSVGMTLRVVVPGADAIATAAVSAAALGLDLARRLADLSSALTNLVLAPTGAVPRSQAVAALDAIRAFIHADPALNFFDGEFDQARADLVDAVTQQEVQDAVLNLGWALESFAQYLADTVQHGFTFGLATTVVTALPGSPARFPILLRNTGTEATTFDLSIAGPLPSGVTAAFDRDSITLQPGEALDGGPDGVFLNLTFTGTELFPTSFTVQAAAQTMSGLYREARGAVAVRAEFIQVAAVTVSPTFTEPGGNVAVSARILNAVNREQTALVSYVVTDASGTAVFTSSAQPVTLGLEASLVTVDLGAFDTTGFARGDYTIDATVTDSAGDSIPGGTGKTSLLIGTPVSATLTVDPLTVLAALDTTVTNILQVDVQESLPSPLTLAGQVQTTPTATTILLAGGVAYVAGTNGVDIVDVSNPIAPVVVGTFAQNLIVQGGFTVVRQLSSDRILIASRGVQNTESFDLLTYSIADPLDPQLVGQSTVTAHYLSDLFVAGDRAFITTNGVTAVFGQIIEQFGDVISLDLADPSAATITDKLYGSAGDVFNQNGGALVDPTTLYVASSTSTGSSTQNGAGVVRVIDISDPANLTQVRQVTIPETVHALEIAIDGNRALVVGSTGGWKTPISGPGDVQLLGNLTLTVLDISDSRNPVVVGSTLVTDSENRPVETADGGAKLSTLALGDGRFAVSRGYVDGKPVLLIVDASDPAGRIAAAALEVPALVNEMAVANGQLYTTSGAGLLIYDINAMESTLVTASVQVPNSLDNHVRAGSFNVEPSHTIPGAGFDTLVWERFLAFGMTGTTITWQTDVAGLSSGEARDVTLGTTLDFVSQGTPGSVALPATTVTAANVLSLSPAEQTVTAGETATFTVTLSNPTDGFLTYTLTVQGVPTAWQSIERTVFVDAHDSTSATLRLTPDMQSAAGDHGFVITATTGGALAGSVEGSLTLVAPPITAVDPDAHGVVAALTPTQAPAGQGTAATFVLRLTNSGSTTETFDLVPDLPPGVTGVLSQTAVTVPPGVGSYRDVRLTVTPAPGTAPGDVGFRVDVMSQAATALAEGTLTVLAQGVAVALDSTAGAPGDIFQVTVTNTGAATDTFDLSVGGPAGLAAILETQAVTLEPGASQVVTLTTGSMDFAVPGFTDLTVVARSQTDAAAADAGAINLFVGATAGLESQFDPAVQVLAIPGTADFLLYVNNTGNAEDAYTATISGLHGPVSANLIGLDGQPTQTIPIFRLPALSTGAIRIQTDLAAAGQGEVMIQVQSLNHAGQSANVIATVRTEPTNQAPPPPTITVPPLLDQLVLQKRTFLVRGTTSEEVTVRFDWLFRHAAFRSEIGIIRVDGANGAIGGIKPGDRRYLRAAMAAGRWQTVFKSGQSAGARTQLTFRGGERFVVYLVQDGRTHSVLQRLRRRRPSPLVFFMPRAANRDRLDHVRITKQRHAGKPVVFQLNWEDLAGNGDRDFNDVVMAIRAAPAGSSK